MLITSAEKEFSQEILLGNHRSFDPFYGPFFKHLRASLSDGGSEFGLAMTLFSLVVTTQAQDIIEIGRFRGFSTLALAGGLRFLDEGWQEPVQHQQRPDVNYAELHAPKPRKLISIDPIPTKEAETLICETGLTPYVEFLNAFSSNVELTGQADIIFIDGDHSYEGCKRDYLQVIPKNLKPGGYFILHDYYGWFGKDGSNNSPIKKVIDEIVAEGRYEHILMDTHYMSFVIFRRPK